jgi:hypothetical protein
VDGTVKYGPGYHPKKNMDMFWQIVGRDFAPRPAKSNPAIEPK